MNAADYDRINGELELVTASLARDVRRAIADGDRALAETRLAALELRVVEVCNDLRDQQADR